MGGVLLSARAVQRGPLDWSLEAQAHGIAEQVCIFNRRPGVDSLLELVPELRDGVSAAELKLLLGLVGRISGHNVEQLRALREIAGWADELAVDLHSVEVRGEAVGLVGQQEIARRLRGPLAVLQNVSDEVVDAVREVDAVLASTPSAQLLRPSVGNLLGARKFRRLTVLVGRREGRSR